jgi:hypothetical protein
MTPAQQVQMAAEALTLQITDKEILADLMWPASASSDEIRARFDALEPPARRDAA